jgi:ABC-type ATPase with predicted acetyltransferase domain
MTEQEFLQLQNSDAQKPKAESKLVGEESKDENVVMWKCPKCEVFMDFDSKCTKCGQLSRDDEIV